MFKRKGGRGCQRPFEQCSKKLHFSYTMASLKNKRQIELSSILNNKLWSVSENWVVKQFSNIQIADVTYLCHQKIHHKHPSSYNPIAVHYSASISPKSKAWLFCGIFVIYLLTHDCNRVQGLALFTNEVREALTQILLLSLWHNLWPISPFQHIYSTFLL